MRSVSPKFEHINVGGVDARTFWEDTAHVLTGVGDERLEGVRKEGREGVFGEVHE
jgi:hypothetical protein